MNSIDFFEKLKEFEGFRSVPYKCPSGVLTIGYGHTYGVIPGMVVDKFEASYILLLDIEVVKLQLSAIHSHFFSFPIGLRCSLIDFVFNVGISSYKRSSLCKVVEEISPICNNFDDTSRQRISVELHKWCFAKGKKLLGLVKRRNWECELLYMDIIDDINFLNLMK